MNIDIVNEFVQDDCERIINDLIFDSSDDDELSTGGSRKGKSPNLNRNRTEKHNQLYVDYFALHPTYNNVVFQRRFRITKPIFLRILNELQSTDKFFQQQKDCTGLIGLSGYQKVTSALRQLAYGCTADSVDEYLGISETSALLSSKAFCSTVVQCFGEEYLRYPNQSDMNSMQKRASEFGFPGMLGSIDCSKWFWKNCPTAHQGHFTGKEGSPALTIEAIADDRLWIWHLFFGMPGSANDINVLEASTLGNAIANGSYPLPFKYNIGNEVRHVPYWLADGIYPKWPCFLHSPTEPSNMKEKLLKEKQESRRKDVERAFGVLQGKWNLMSRPSRLWNKDVMNDIVKCCVVLHNMMVEDRCIDEDANLEYFHNGLDTENAVSMWGENVYQLGNDEAEGIAFGSVARLCAFEDFKRNRVEYHKTRELVVNNLWDMFGNNSL